MGVIMPLPTYPLSPTQFPGSCLTRTSDSRRQCASWRHPSIASEIHARSPLKVQATCTFMPVVLCLPEYSSGCEAHDQHGSRVPSTMYWILSLSSSAVGTYFLRTFSSSGVIPVIARLIVDWDTSYVSASST